MFPRRAKGVRRAGASTSLVDKEAILKDTATLAARYEVDVTTSVRANAAPEEAILQEIRACRANMVVMGVDRIHGDTLSFGAVADAVLRKSKVSVLLVSNGEAGR
jgi:nucleotide-binding universal stress UspA family protein